MLTRLSHEELEMLKKLVLDKAPDLAQFTEDRMLSGLSKEGKEKLQGILLNELLEAGLQEDDEPNDRGLLIDSVIGKIQDA